MQNDPLTQFTVKVGGGSQEKTSGLRPAEKVLWKVAEMYFYTEMLNETIIKSYTRIKYKL